ncbi:hypothetical protein ACFSCX_04390 [Bacillus salitolerans]|uniref:Flagellar hook-length control protein FliK n=1 Tax=Bacillus salitolerans TaxID=1437434 RepID=A0ABW4LKX6_9BACI
MNPIQIMQTLAKSDHLAKVNVSTLRPGQLFFGKIEKLFPNQTALVQLGAMRIHAQLEASLNIMERHWFEVQPSKEGDIRLRVLDERPNGHHRSQESTHLLLRQFNLPESKPNQQLLQFLLSKELPFTKELLLKAAEWVKETKDMSKALPALEFMIKKELPFTHQTYKSMVALQDSSSLTHQLEKLSNLINGPKFEHSTSIQLLRHTVSSLLGLSTADEGIKVATELLKQWLSPNSNVEGQETSYRLLQKLNILPARGSQEQVISDLIHQLDVKKSITAPVQNTSEKPMLKVSPTASEGKQTSQLLDLLLNSSKVTQSIISPERTQKLPSQISALLNSNESLNEAERKLLRQINDQYLQPKLKLDSGTDVKQLFRQVFESLGLEYEKKLESWVKFGNQEIAQELEELKPLLMKVIKEAGVSGKELEPFMHRLTGLQLLSQETSGPLQQLFMQFPLNFGEKRTDLTLQWSGRRTKDGQIDPSFCRILFYLDLQNIEQTVIDMQVQNRVINIHIINDTEGLESLLLQHQEVLKAQLAELNYTLSKVKLVPSTLHQKPLSHKLPTGKNLFSQESYQGVDLRI